MKNENEKYERVFVTLPKNVIEDIKEEAKSLGITEDEFGEKIIGEYVKDWGHNGFIEYCERILNSKKRNR